MDFSSSWKAAQSLLRRLQQEQHQEKEEVTAVLLHAAQVAVSILAKNRGEKQQHASITPAEIEAPVMVMLKADSARWDCLCVGLMLCNEALQAMAPAPVVSPDLTETLYSVIEQHLEHEEPRVRSLVAKTLGTLCSVPSLGVDVYLRFRTQLWASIDTHLQHRPATTMPTAYGESKEVVMDDVTGWRSLETSMLALIAITEGCGPELARGGLLDAAWLERTVYLAAVHTNRYVREASMDMVRALVEHGGAPEKEKLARVVAEGLADAWPQVVYKASRATRSLLLTTDKEHENIFFPVLLPRLCLSRYFVPEGVQVYAQDTWVLLFGEGGGRPAVARHMPAMVQYYVNALEAGKSHFARIAACYAIKELAAKVQKEEVAPYAAEMIGAVLPCLEHVHWEVRSAGCTALAQLATTFPSVVQAEEEQVIAKCFVCLEDESWSIREDAALALSALAHSSSNDKKDGSLIDRLARRLQATLGQAKEQPTQTKDEQFRRFNDPQGHTGRPIFGCCGGLEQQGAEGNHAHVHKYDAQPWEVSEGALYLFRELCAEDLRPSEGFADEHLLLIADMTHLQHFADADRLKQTIWKVLPEVFALLGKSALKRHLEFFTPALMAALSSPLSSPLTRHAALSCLEVLSVQMGRSIFLGRLQERERGLFLASCSAMGGNSASSASPCSSSSRPSIVSM